MGRRYKPLLPAARSPRSPSEPDEQPPSATKRKRVYVKIACDICRMKKSACDGQRPACTPCTKRKSPCTFSGRPAGSDEARSPGSAAVNDDSESAASLVAALLTAHDGDAHELLDRMRQGRGTLEVSGSSSQKDTEAGRGPTPLPPDQTSFEFELMIKHPIAYPALVPLDSRSDNASNGDRLETARNKTKVEEDGVANQDVPGSLRPEASLRYGAFEEKLRHVHFARWTKVAVSGSEAAAAIANYLAHDNVLLQLFDPEIFLDSLANDREDFCSSLLVNALLGWSLPSIAIQSGKEGVPARAAYETALRQLESHDQMPASLGTLAAVELLSLTALFRGYGEKSKDLLQKAVLLGKRLGLFLDMKDPFVGTDGHDAAKGEDVVKATASWGLFSLTTMLSFHCQRYELEPTVVPAYPCPESATAVWWSAIPAYMSRLWIMIQEINSRYYRKIENVSNKAEGPFVSAMLTRLLRWSDELPVALARGNRCTQETLIMHVLFHATIMTLTYPLVLSQDAAPLIEGESANRSAEAIHSASAAQMHRLVDIHLDLSRTSAINVLWHTAFLFSANASIRSTAGSLDIRRRRFLRAMDGYAELYPRYPVIQTIFRGLMAMAVEAEFLESQEALQLARRLAKSEENGPKRVDGEPEKACFVIDLKLALIDREMAVVNVLAQRFDEIAMFDDFTHENHEFFEKDTGFDMGGMV